jgi:CheY-like chemotaxis protein
VHDAWHPDLVLMDLRMPGIGGIEAIDRLRRAGSRSVLIAFTANSIDAADAEVRRVGADELILKPYADAEFLGAIGRHLGVRYAYEESRSHAHTPATGVSSLVPLAAMLSLVAPALREELRAAVVAARTGRIEELATQIARVSPDAALAVRDLATKFNYDRILTAIDAAGRIDA